MRFSTFSRPGNSASVRGPFRFKIFFYFFTFFCINNIKLIVKKCIFIKFFGAIRGFLILSREKKRKKTNVHHTPARGSSVVVAISVPYCRGLMDYGVDRPPLSWL